MGELLKTSVKAIGLEKVTAACGTEVFFLGINITHTHLIQMIYTAGGTKEPREVTLSSLEIGE